MIYVTSLRIHIKVEIKIYTIVTFELNMRLTFGGYLKAYVIGNIGWCSIFKKTDMWFPAVIGYPEAEHFVSNKCWSLSLRNDIIYLLLSRCLSPVVWISSSYALKKKGTVQIVVTNLYNIFAIIRNHIIALKYTFS